MNVMVRIQYDAYGMKVMLGERVEFILAVGSSEVSLRPAPPGAKRITGEHVHMILEVKICKDVSAKREELLENLDPDSATLPNLPPSLKDFVNEAHSEILALAEQAVGLIRWHSDCLSDPHPLTLFSPMEWSEDGKDWHPFITSIEVGMRFLGSPTLTDGVRTAIQEDMAAGKREPLAFELFHEAMALKDNSPRSALLMLISAAEYSVKSCISDLVPDAGWLVLNLPSPDIVKLITDYLPQVNEDARVSFQEPRDSRVSAWLKELQAAVQARNALIHRGQGAPDEESLDRKFDAVYGLLRLMDFYAGRIWAIEHIDRDWMTALRLEDHAVDSQEAGDGDPTAAVPGEMLGQTTNPSESRRDSGMDGDSPPQ
jgi:hypothetical protein